MSEMDQRFLFASAPDGLGVLDYPGPSREQSYEKMLDEMRDAGYAGSELEPYGFFLTDADVLGPQLAKRRLKLLGSFVPVKMGGYSGWSVVEQDVKFGDTAMPPAESVAASLKYLRGAVSELDGAGSK